MFCLFAEQDWNAYRCAGRDCRALARTLEEADEKPPMEPRVHADSWRTKLALPTPRPTTNCSNPCIATSLADASGTIDPETLRMSYHENYSQRL